MNMNNAIVYHKEPGLFEHGKQGTMAQERRVRKGTFLVPASKLQTKYKIVEERRPNHSSLVLPSLGNMEVETTDITLKFDEELVFQGLYEGDEGTSHSVCIYLCLIHLHYTRSRREAN
jgi:hypothetical protein